MAYTRKAFFLKTHYGRDLGVQRFPTSRYKLDLVLITDPVSIKLTFLRLG